jgi:hypothetical protein
MSPPKKAPPAVTSGASEALTVIGNENADTPSVGQAKPSGMSQRLNAQRLHQYEFILPRRSPEDVRLDNLDRERRVGPFFRRLDAATATRAKAVFKAAHTAVVHGDAAEGGRLLEEWRRLTKGGR